MNRLAFGFIHALLNAIDNNCPVRWQSRPSVVKYLCVSKLPRLLFAPMMRLRAIERKLFWKLEAERYARWKPDPNCQIPPMNPPVVPDWKVSR